MQDIGTRHTSYELTGNSTPNHSMHLMIMKDYCRPSNHLGFLISQNKYELAIEVVGSKVRSRPSTHFLNLAVLDTAHGRRLEAFGHHRTKEIQNTKYYSEASYNYYKYKILDNNLYLNVIIKYIKIKTIAGRGH